MVEANESAFVLQIYPEPDSEKIIMGSVVYCIHHKDGCKWSGELRKLKAHLNVCKHDAASCSAGCGAHIPRLLMDDHLQYTCPQRPARCAFCACDFTGASLEAHAGACGWEPVYCENKCGVKIQRRLVDAHRAADCAKRLVACRHCSADFVADTLSAHASKCGRAPVACPNRCDAPVLLREELDAHLASCPALVVSCAFRDAGCRFKGLRHTLDQHLDESTRQHLGLMCGLVSKQQQQIVSLKSALQRLSLNQTGTLIWKIADYSAKMAEAKSRDGMELVSPAFYTSQYGYKLQASVFLNGNGAGEGSHMSVYIKILPGEYDALLRWPFAHSVSFTLFDQSSVPEKVRDRSTTTKLTATLPA